MERARLFRWWGPCFLIALGWAASRPLVGGEMINVAGESATSTLSGYVYADINNNGLPDSFEHGISGVEITLQGHELSGDIVSLTTWTNKYGDYLFADLSPGKYSVTETQPLKFIEGKANEVGSAGGVALSSDRFVEIGLAARVAAVNYNFGEWGLKAKYISKADLLIPEPSAPVTLATAFLALAAFARLRQRRSSTRCWR
jgi:MYXO-CTERM domain-containing protein